MLPLIMRLVWTLPCLYNAVGVCAVLCTPARVDAAPFSVVGIVVMLPFLLLLVYALSFIPLLG